MPFQLKKKVQKVDPPAVVQETIQGGPVEQVSGQSVADPTVGPILGSSSETFSTQTAKETGSVTEQEIQIANTGGMTHVTASELTPTEIIAQGGTEHVLVELERVLIETCEAAVVGPPEAVAASIVVPSTALAVVKQEETAVVKKPVLSARTLKTWGRSVKDPDKKANLLLPGVHPDFAGDLVITKLVDNPKLPGKGPWMRFAKYKNGMTVAEYIKACERVSPSVKVSHADLKWDVNHGYILVSAAQEEGVTKAEEKAA
jgi:hypothetical protein